MKEFKTITEVMEDMVDDYVRNRKKLNDIMLNPIPWNGSRQEFFDEAIRRGKKKEIIENDTGN